MHVLNKNNEKSVFGDLEGIPGGSWRRLGWLGDAIGGPWEVSGASLEDPGGVWGALEAPPEAPERSWRRLGRSGGAPGGPGALRERFYWFFFYFYAVLKGPEKMMRFRPTNSAASRGVGGVRAGRFLRKIDWNDWND